jgi:hypothetical protein
MNQELRGVGTNVKEIKGSKGFERSMSYKEEWASSFS